MQTVLKTGAWLRAVISTCEVAYVNGDDLTIPCAGDNLHW